MRKRSMLFNGIICIDFETLFQNTINQEKKIAYSAVQTIFHFAKLQHELYFIIKSNTDEDLIIIWRNILHSEKIRYHEVIYKNDTECILQLKKIYKKIKVLRFYAIGLNDLFLNMFTAADFKNVDNICFQKSKGDNIHYVKKWDEIIPLIKKRQRNHTVHRKTKETDVLVSIDLDGNGIYQIDTGIGFFNHMLEQFSKHSLCDLSIQVTGDLHIDEHHTIEDTAISFGEAFAHALGDKQKIERYGFVLPMDDALAQVAIDFGGRNWLVWDVQFKREKIGDMPTELFFHFFKSFSDSAKCNINIQADGDIEHHKIESIFKCFAKAVKMAVSRDERITDIPSTKGLI